jgi:nitroreductase
MDVDQAVRQRMSVRAFTGEPVTRAQLHDILDVARRAPSGGNLQPWRIIAVAGAEKDALTALARETLAANPRGEAGERPIYPDPVVEPYRSRRFKIGEDMYAILGIGREDKFARLAHMARNYEFFGAPAALFFVIDRNMGHGQWAHVGMLMQTIALVAEARGLGTCMQEAWGMVRESLHRHFGLGAHEMIYCGMAIGHPDRSAPINGLRSDRAPVEEIATFMGFPD